jgi:hypothetical protein
MKWRNYSIKVRMEAEDDKRMAKEHKTKAPRE